MVKRIIIVCISLLLAITFSSIGVKAENRLSANSYQYNLVDGRGYKIKNVLTNTYMTLENGSTALNTRVVLSSYTGESSQKFTINYLGDGRYYLVPYYAYSMRLSIDTSTSSNLVLAAKSYTSNYIRFTIKVIDSYTYKIYTNSSSNNNVLCSYSSLLEGECVKQCLDNNLSSSLWEIEEVDENSEAYNTFYFRDITNNMFITANSLANGSSLTLEKFDGGEKQRFKHFSSDGAEGVSYFLASMVKNDMGIKFLDSGGLQISNLNFNTGQGISFEYVSAYDGYKIKSNYGISTRYISLGQQITNNGETSYYLTTTTNSNNAIIFEIINARFRTPFIYNVKCDEIKSKITHNYAERSVYTFMPDHNGEYNFSAIANIGSNYFVIYDEDEVAVDGYVLDDTQVTNTYYLTKNKIYYIIIVDHYNVTTDFSFYILSDLVVYLHGMYYSLLEESRSYMLTIESNLNSLDYYDPIVNNKCDMTASFVRNEDNTTGLIPLQAPVYVFSGHGISGGAGVVYVDDQYDETYLYASNLYNFNTNTVVFDMSGNKLVIWLGCETAYGNSSIAEAAYMAGASCSVGFEGDLLFVLSDLYLIRFFNELSTGKTIYQSLNDAKANINLLSLGINTMVIFGDSSQVIAPEMENLEN